MSRSIGPVRPTNNSNDVETYKSIIGVLKADLIKICLISCEYLENGGVLVAAAKRPHYSLCFTNEQTNKLTFRQLFRSNPPVVQQERQ